jgi:hypothetical protein
MTTYSNHPLRGIVPLNLLREGVVPGFYHPSDEPSRYDSRDPYITDGQGKPYPIITTPPPCRLCLISSPTKLFFLADDFCIIECPICSLPLLVSSHHSLNVSLRTYNYMIKKVSDIFYYNVLTTQESEVDHFNMHIFPNSSQDPTAFQEKHDQFLR